MILVLGVMLTSATSENHENERFSGFPKMNLKIYSKTKQNNSTEFLGYSFDDIYNKNGPPDPLDPRSGFFPGFLRFSTGTALFSRKDLVGIARQIRKKATLWNSCPRRGIAGPKRGPLSVPLTKADFLQ